MWACAASSESTDQAVSPPPTTGSGTCPAELAYFDERSLQVTEPTPAEIVAGIERLVVQAERAVEESD